MKRDPFERVEYRLFDLALADAQARAERRDLPGGFACLLAGLDRAREYLRTGLEWARPLERSYALALESYVRRYHRE